MCVVPVIVWAVLLVVFIVLEFEFFTEGLFWLWLALGAERSRRVACDPSQPRSPYPLSTHLG